MFFYIFIYIFSLIEIKTIWKQITYCILEAKERRLQAAERHRGVQQTGAQSQEAVTQVPFVWRPYVFSEAANQFADVIWGNARLLRLRDGKKTASVRIIQAFKKGHLRKGAGGETEFHIKHLRWHSSVGMYLRQCLLNVLNYKADVLSKDPM